MARTLTLCVVGTLEDADKCDQRPEYRLEVRTSERRQATLYLCSAHVHRAWHLGQLALDRRFPGENLLVRSIHLHQIPRASAAEAAS
jgi:hypothetical protein